MHFSLWSGFRRRLDGCRLFDLLCGRFGLGVWGSEDALGFGEEVQLAFVWNADVSSKCETQGEAGQLVVCGRVDGGKQYLFGAALFVLVVPCNVLGQVVGEGVGVKVD